MNKSELVLAMAHEAKLSKKDADSLLKAMIAVVTKQLKKTEKEAKVIIPGFFTVSKVKRNARTGRNPQTGKEIKIPAKNVARFKTGATLNAAL